MTESWREKQLCWLANGHEVRRRELDSSLEFEKFPQPASSQLALLGFFTDALDQKTSPKAAAGRILDWVLSVPDTDSCYDMNTACSNMLGVLLDGARQLSDRQHLKTLADLTVELANIPDVYNTRDTPMAVEGAAIQPGDKIRLPSPSGDALWFILPDFAHMISVGLIHGPPQHFHAFQPGEDLQPMYRAAEEIYTNVNIYASFIAQQHSLRPGCPLNSCLHSAFGVIAFLEAAPGTPRGDYAYLAVRGTAAWLTITGQKLVELGSPSTQHDYMSGSLWTVEGGRNIVDANRLQFWKRRFQELRTSGTLVSQAAVDATHEATRALDDLLETSSSA